jgi:hypothetical protein
MNHEINDDALRGYMQGSVGLVTAALTSMRARDTRLADLIVEAVNQGRVNFTITSSLVPPLITVVATVLDSGATVELVRIVPNDDEPAARPSTPEGVH